MTPIKIINTVLLTEDYARCRQLVVEVLNEAFADIEIVEAEDLAQARYALNVRNFDLAIIDLNLPDGSGIDLITQIRAKTPATYCVVVTTMDDDDSLFSSLEAGAHGYLLKHESKSKLISQLQGILQGDPPLSPSIAQRILRYFNHEKITKTSSTHNLAPREIEVLVHISKGLQRKQIAKNLGISQHTTSDYVKAIYRKLKVSSRAEAAVAAINLGIA